MSMLNGTEARKAAGEEDKVGEGEGTKKKRLAERCSLNRNACDEEPHRRVRRGKESVDWADSRGLDDVEAALPEMLDLSGRADLCTAAMHELIAAQPRSSILRLDGCVVLPAPFERLCVRARTCVARACVARARVVRRCWFKVQFRVWFGVSLTY